MLVGVAQQTGREIQVLEQRGASPDHPVSSHLPGERVPEVLHLPGGLAIFSSTRIPTGFVPVVWLVSP